MEGLTEMEGLLTRKSDAGPMSPDELFSWQATIMGYVSVLSSCSMEMRSSCVTSQTCLLGVNVVSSH